MTSSGTIALLHCARNFLAPELQFKPGYKTLDEAQEGVVKLLRAAPQHVFSAHARCDDSYESHQKNMLALTPVLFHERFCQLAINLKFHTVTRNLALAMVTCCKTHVINADSLREIEAKEEMEKQMEEMRRKRKRDADGERPAVIKFVFVRGPGSGKGGTERGSYVDEKEARALGLEFNGDDDMF